MMVGEPKLMISVSIHPLFIVVRFMSQLILLLSILYDVCGFSSVVRQPSRSE